MPQKRQLNQKRSPDSPHTPRTATANTSVTETPKKSLYTPEKQKKTPLDTAFINLDAELARLFKHKNFSGNNCRDAQSTYQVALSNGYATLNKQNYILQCAQTVCIVNAEKDNWGTHSDTRRAIVNQAIQPAIKIARGESTKSVVNELKKRDNDHTNDAGMISGLAAAATVKNNKIEELQQNLEALKTKHENEINKLNGTLQEKNGELNIAKIKTEFFKQQAEQKTQLDNDSINTLQASGKTPQQIKDLMRKSQYTSLFLTLMQQSIIQFGANIKNYPLLKGKEENVQIYIFLSIILAWDVNIKTPCETAATRLGMDKETTRELSEQLQKHFSTSLMRAFSNNTVKNKPQTIANNLLQRTVGPLLAKIAPNFLADKKNQSILLTLFNNIGRSRNPSNTLTLLATALRIKEESESKAIVTNTQGTSKQPSAITPTS
jgi:hypothetical protein